MQNKELTVISSEIRKGSPNLRTRRTQSLKGGIITFVTSCEVFEHKSGAFSNALALSQA